ncbi:hypothetical protein COT63_02455 [Candidatus Shapirobacteria bacterium CG09_land_8_20_14_0_10_38_17]|uniref:Uncharacterized protein n=1 Tax=Candidatus Shapirobacteria bacterium CG09_land_8_20_14_0_10_38_17 TaxID=1974884 RepID=A0A2H0WSS0_9BACT|nr:MAG: hypothetical protein COT63_02455 [Candidatus Shapirobacteria bacterium CG09_land_8_20_14_0_10_38_17]
MNETGEIFPTSAEVEKSPSEQLQEIAAAIKHHRGINFTEETKEKFKEFCRQDIQERYQGTSVGNRDTIQFLDIVTCYFTQFPPLEKSLNIFTKLDSQGQPAEITNTDIEEVLVSLEQSGIKVKKFSKLNSKAKKVGLTLENDDYGNLASVRKKTFNVLTKTPPEILLPQIIHDLVHLTLNFGINLSAKELGGQNYHWG